MRTLLIISLLCLSSTSAYAALQGREVSYQANEKNLKGYLAYDHKLMGKRPAVLVVYDRWGQNEYARKRANMLAELGYTALAVDVYGDGVQATHPDEAGKLTSEVDKIMPLAKLRFAAGMRFLSKQRTVDENRIAAIGYGFGGTLVLNLARIGENLKGVASFYGGLDTDKPAESGTIKARIISFSGEADPINGAGKLDAFKKEMGSAGADYQVITYSGVRHSFANPDAGKLGRKLKLPMAYNAVADQDSWGQTIVFLRESFAKK